MPCRSPPERLATVESTVMPTPRKPMACLRMSFGDRLLAADIDEAEAVGDLAPDEEIAPERLLLRQRFVLVDGLDRQVVRHAHGVVGKVEFPVADEYPPRRWREHARQHLDQRRLSGAVVADQPDDFVAADRKIDVAQRLDRAEEFLHAFKAHYVPVVGFRLRFDQVHIRHPLLPAASKQVSQKCPTVFR